MFRASAAMNFVYAGSPMYNEDKLAPRGRQAVGGGCRTRRKVLISDGMGGKPRTVETPRPSDMIARVRAIPNAQRAFGCDEHAARLHSGLSAQALDALVEEGLPSAEVGGERYFELGDLHYVGLRLGSARRYLWAVRRWTTSLKLFAGRTKTGVRIAYRPELPVGAGPVWGAVVLPGGGRRKVILEPGCVVAEPVTVLHGSWPPLPSAAARIVAEVAASVELYILPNACVGDTQLVRETGLSDCHTSALLIANEWRAAGLDSRVVQGLLVTQPYSIFHSWPEVRVGRAWLAVDPLTLRAMGTFGGLDVAAWPAHSCIGPMVARAGMNLVALIESEAGSVKGTFLTCVVGQEGRDRSGPAG